MKELVRPRDVVRGERLQALPLRYFVSEVSSRLLLKVINTFPSVKLHMLYEN